MILALLFLVTTVKLTNADLYDDYMEKGILLQDAGQASMDFLITTQYAIVTANFSQPIDEDVDRSKLCRIVGLSPKNVSYFSDLFRGHYESSTLAREFAKDIFHIRESRYASIPGIDSTFQRCADDSLAVKVTYTSPKVYGSLYEMIDVGRFTNDGQLFRFRKVPKYMIVIQNDTFYSNNCGDEREYYWRRGSGDFRDLTAGYYYSHQICTKLENRCIRTKFEKCEITTVTVDTDDDIVNSRNSYTSDILAVNGSVFQINIVYQDIIELFNQTFVGNKPVHWRERHKETFFDQEHDNSTIEELPQAPIPDLTTEEIDYLVKYGHEEDERLEKLCLAVYKHPCDKIGSFNFVWILVLLVIALVLGAIVAFLVHEKHFKPRRVANAEKISFSRLVENN